MRKNSSQILSSNKNSNSRRRQEILIYQICENHAEQRLDNFLRNKLKNIPKSHIYRIIRKGQVRVNKKRKKPDYRLCLGDEVRIPPLFFNTIITKKLSPTDKIIKSLEKKIIYEDQDFLIIDKPSGIAAHGGSGINFGLIEILRAARPNSSYLELAHRLDRETSGCILIAKKRAFLRYFHELLRNGKIAKKYIALVKGKTAKKEIKVTQPLIKNVLTSGERYVKVDKKGKVAITIFKTIKNIGNVATLLEVKLQTGKTHQIRVHTAHIGHPIAGDDKYGDKEFNKFMKNKGLDRLFLHAHSLKFYIKNRVQPFEIKVNLPKILEIVLEKLHN